MKKFFSLWLLLVIVVSCIIGIIYVVVQQDLRIGANDPQIQMAEDIANTLSHKQEFQMPEPVDISQSLSPFVMLYNKDKRVISFSPLLHNTIPQLPSGILDYVSTHGEDRFTWQPESGVRIAAVVVSYNNGYVLAGRNLREVEKREDQLFYQIILGWIATLGVSFIAVFFLQRK